MRLCNPFSLTGMWPPQLPGIVGVVLPVVTVFFLMDYLNYSPSIQQNTSVNVNEYEEHK